MVRIICDQWTAYLQTKHVKYTIHVLQSRSDFLLQGLEKYVNVYVYVCLTVITQ